MTSKTGRELLKQYATDKVHYWKFSGQVDLEGFESLAHKACESIIDGAANAPETSQARRMYDYYASASDLAITRLFNAIERG